MSRLDDAVQTFGEGNVTQLMVLGIISYCERMTAAIDRARKVSPPSARRAAATVERAYPFDLAVLGLESFGVSVASLCGPDTRPRREPRTRSSARPAARALRQVLR